MFYKTTLLEFSSHVMDLILAWLLCDRGAMLAVVISASMAGVVYPVIDNGGMQLLMTASEFLILCPRILFQRD